MPVGTSDCEYVELGTTTTEPVAVIVCVIAGESDCPKEIVLVPLDEEVEYWMEVKDESWAVASAATPNAAATTEERENIANELD